MQSGCKAYGGSQLKNMAPVSLDHKFRELVWRAEEVV